MQETAGERSIGMDIAKYIEDGKATLGVEFGSTRIKGVLIDEKGTPIASGSYEWENRLENGIWTYPLEEVWAGLAACYADLTKDVREKYQVMITQLKSIGVSAMMHGYLAFDQEGKLLAPFRTWRNTITQEASEKLTDIFHFHIPQRWSIAHFYQAMLNREEHVSQVAFFTTLAGYVHWILTGEKVLGIGDASGMFPIDSTINDYDQKMLDQFDAAAAAEGYTVNIRALMPKCLVAGEDAGSLTEQGAALLDQSGNLKAGARFCPPEGDAGTGMAATNSVGKRTGNVSAGTSIFSMIVLDEAMKELHEEIDMVTTPDGAPVAMVHCNNGTSDLNAWVGLFGEFAKAAGIEMDTGKLFGTLYNEALGGDPDCGGLLTYGFFSGEHNVGMEEGRPLVIRRPDDRFNLANFMRSNLLTSFGILGIGNEILRKEHVRIDRITGHGGLFKTPVVGQKLLAACMNAPVAVMETAGEGGAWGIALLAAYLTDKAEGQSLADYLENNIFGGNTGTSIDPDPEDVKGFEAFMERYKKCLPVERAAIDSLKE